MSQVEHLRLQLQAAETALRASGLWAENPPAPEALLSVQPFCIDTLNFSEWLQFVFLLRMQHLVDNQLPLPVNCAIAPMAEEALAGLPVAELLTALRSIDELLSE